MIKAPQVWLTDDQGALGARLGMIKAPQVWLTNDQGAPGVAEA